MGRAVDFFVVYRFLKLLVTPWEKQEAYKLGIIDKKGNAGVLLKKVEKKKEIKISGQSKIEINPKVEIGQYSGGSQVNTGNLH